jgi:hypothetical protein
MQDDVGGEVTAELSEPHTHFFKGREIGYAVAEDTGVGTSIVEARY